jgi:phage shock protein C
MSTPATQTNLLFRNDTLFGVCEALGEDFGISPTWFRIAFAAPLLVNPMAVVAAYFATGALVLATRVIFPNLSSLDSRRDVARRPPRSRPRRRCWPQPPLPARTS